MIVISAYHAGNVYPKFKYFFYSKREAITLYKAHHGLKGRHGVEIHIS